MATINPPVGTFNSGFNSPWSAGASGSGADVPDPFLISIQGRTYLHDLEFKPWKRQAMRATTTSITRTQADTSNEPGEQSLSTESLWRRTQDSWHLGAGQVYLDRKGSSEFAFRSSKGVNPWTEWQLTLLNDTIQDEPDSANNTALAICGSHIYATFGQELRFSNGSGWTTVTGTPADNASSLCSDGHTVWVTYGAGGVYSTTEGAATATQYITSAVDTAAVIRFTLGRLMLGSGNKLYNIVTSGALPTALLTAVYGTLTWTDVTTGNGVIFAAANSGNQFGVVYSIQITSDGTSLGSPIVCAQMPNGETINAIYGYAGSAVFIGTNLGWRLSEQALANDVAGTVSLTIGPLTALPSPVRAFAGYNRFVWGTLENYDSGSTGLFRIDPTQFVADLAPAYASDLMTPYGVSYQGEVTSVAILNGVVYFAVAGEGVFKQYAVGSVLSGTLDGGLITYGLADPKMPVFVDIATEPLTGSIETSVSLDGGNFTRVGTAAQAGATLFEFNTPQVLSNTVEIREALEVPSIFSEPPVLTRHTLRAAPAPPVPTDWNVVIQLRETVRIKDVEHALVPSDEYKFLDTLRKNKTICSIQIGNIGPFSATVESIDWIPEQWASLSGELNGVAVLTCRTVV